MTNKQIFTCLIVIFLYLLIQGCTQPEDLITPVHLTLVPNVQNLQGLVDYTVTGKRMVLLTWRFDSTNTNIRSWDITRSLGDTAAGAYIPLEIVRKPVSGFPFFSDSSGSLQNIVADSLDVYYIVIPNGIINNFIGQPSDVLHLILKK
jgi:hypothetical protein